MRSIISHEQEEILKQFNELLVYCYQGCLRSFCQDFLKDDDSFYKKIQKSRLRMKDKKVSPKTLDNFRKYIFFLEYKKIEFSKVLDVKVQKFSMR